MTRLAGLKFANTIYWLLLALWFGALVMSAVTAGVLFPTMRDLEVVVPAYESISELDGEHWRIAAGRAQNTIFFANDLIQLACSVGVAIILGLHLSVFRMSIMRFSNAIRTAAIGFALVALAYHLFILAPRMQTQLVEFWSVTEHGDIDRALAARAAFDEAHPTGTRVLVFITICVMTAIIASAAALTTPEEDAPTIAARRPGALEEPELLKRPRG
ncbi:MAG: hypothetical protein ACF8PN_09695 [Phycisphaerales bacterium]